MKIVRKGNLIAQCSHPVGEMFQKLALCSQISHCVPSDWVADSLQLNFVLCSLYLYCDYLQSFYDPVLKHSKRSVEMYI